MAEDSGRPEAVDQAIDLHLVEEEMDHRPLLEHLSLLLVQELCKVELVSLLLHVVGEDMKVRLLNLALIQMATAEADIRSLFLTLIQALPLDLPGIEGGEAEAEEAEEVEVVEISTTEMGIEVATISKTFIQ